MLGHGWGSQCWLHPSGHRGGSGRPRAALGDFLLPTSTRGRRSDVRSPRRMAAPHCTHGMAGTALMAAAGASRGPGSPGDDVVPGLCLPGDSRATGIFGSWVTPVCLHGARGGKAVLYLSWVTPGWVTLLHPCLSQVTRTGLPALQKAALNTPEFSLPSGGGRASQSACTTACSSCLCSAQCGMQKSSQTK